MQSCLICDEIVEEGLAVRLRYGVVRLNKAYTPYFFPIEMGDGTEEKYAHKACIIQDSIPLARLGRVYEPCPLCRRQYSVDAGDNSPGECVLEVERGFLYQDESSEDRDSGLGFKPDSGGCACFYCASQEWRGVTQQIMGLHLEAPA